MRTVGEPGAGETAGGALAWLAPGSFLCLHAALIVDVGLTQLVGGLPLFLASFVWAVHMTANRWVVSAMATSPELGQFAFGANIMSLIVGSGRCAGPILLSWHYNRGCEAGALSQRAVGNFCRLIVGITVATAVGLTVGPYFIAVLYPNSLHRPVVQILLVALPNLIISVWLMPSALSRTTRQCWRAIPAPCCCWWLHPAADIAGRRRRRQQ